MIFAVFASLLILGCVGVLLSSSPEQEYNGRYKAEFKRIDAARAAERAKNK